jgi:hypothetical protein
MKHSPFPFYPSGNTILLRNSVIGNTLGFGPRDIFACPRSNRGSSANINNGDMKHSPFPLQGLQIVFPGFTKIAYNNCESINRETIASNDSKNHHPHDILFHFYASSESGLDERSSV